MLVIKTIIKNFIKGILIGFGTIIPGVSGGTVAIIVGSFEDILEATSNFFLHIRKSIALIIPLMSGVICGIMILSTPINMFCTYYHSISNYIFCGISLISLFLFIKKSIYGEFSLRKGIFLFSGVISAISITVTINTFENSLTNPEPYHLFLIGIPLSLALILPAISFSYTLLFFGLYEKTVYAIYTFDVQFIFFLGIGMITGTFIFSKILLRLINRYPQEVYSYVLGFVLCSICNLLI